MSKYEQVNTNFTSNEIDKFLVKGETLIWSGKPKKSAFIINKSLMMLPIALLWLAFDSTFIIASLKGGSQMLWFIIPFFAIHLMPVWIWLGNVLTANKRWQNTKYAITDRRIIITSGFIGAECQTIYYKDIKKVNLKIGIIDKLLKVGDIYFETNDFVPTNNNSIPQTAFLDIENIYEIYPKIQKVVLDIQTDIEYPNNLRPDQNDGYQTKYNSKF